MLGKDCPEYKFVEIRLVCPDGYVLSGDGTNFQKRNIALRVSLKRVTSNTI